MQQAEKGAHQVRMCANVELECNGKCELSMSSATASVSSCHHDSISASGSHCGQWQRKPLLPRYRDTNTTHTRAVPRRRTCTHKQRETESKTEDA